ncbi:MAG: T9SS type A sorting domain-containing protein [Bacteroidetes bacterium]|nr:MAG: T9SS type A sorting domain-containing protein [Bacteroidota bacterium]
MNGIMWDGSLIKDPNTGQITKFCVPGDPVAGIGWYEGPGYPGGFSPGDRRKIITAGPFNFAQNDTQEIVVAISVARGGSNLNSITKLKQLGYLLKDWYNNKFVTEVETNNKISIVKEFKLEQNYPNPFNPVTTINYQVPVKSFVSLKIFDILGREVATLVNEEKQQGKYSVEFNESKLSSGVYFFELNAGDFRSVKKMTLLK